MLRTVFMHQIPFLYIINDAHVIAKGFTFFFLVFKMLQYETE